MDGVRAPLQRPPQRGQPARLVQLLPPPRRGEHVTITEAKHSGKRRENVHLADVLALSGRYKVILAGSPFSPRVGFHVFFTSQYRARIAGPHSVRRCSG